MQNNVVNNVQKYLAQADLGKVLPRDAATHLGIDEQELQQALLSELPSGWIRLLGDERKDRLARCADAPEAEQAQAAGFYRVESFRAWKRRCGL